MKKVLSLLTIVCLLLTITACNPTTDPESESEADQSSEAVGAEVITGKVTAIDGNKVTIAVFSQGGQEMEQSEQEVIAIVEGDSTPGESQQGEVPPEIPSGDSQQGQQGEVPPEIPSGDSQQGQQGEVPPDIPSGDSQQGQQGEVPPEKPDGESTQGEEPPEKPEGESMSQPDMPNDPGAMAMTEETRTIEITDTSVLYKKEDDTEVSATLEDIEINSILTITYNENSQITKIVITSESDFRGETPGGDNPGGDNPGGDNPGGGQTPPGGNTSDVVYAGATEITATTEEANKTYTSTTADQSALMISTSDAVTIKNPTLSKTGNSDGGDNCNFYGQNAALLVKGGSVTTITGGTITSDATGANGVFSYGGNGGQNGAAGDGTTVIISDTVITTTGSGSGGIMTTGGGITKASNLTVTTSGQSSAAIRTDRGGGTVTVSGGTYTTNGLGSPSVYSTADITVSDAVLISNLSEGVCIEGLNSVTLNNTDLTANNTKCNGNATFYDTIMIYQSMSGDAASGTSTFTMSDGSLTSKNGHVFHVTNTSAVITLSNVTITNEDSDNILLSVCDDGWSGGSNTAVLNADSQILRGGILVGDNSSLTMTLSDSSSFTGYVSGNIQNANGKTVSETVGEVSVTLTGGSIWTLTQDSYITNFSGDASNVISNGYTLYVNGVALTGTK